jgi:CRISPR-associated endonuclease/helicase Cas3
MTFEEFNAAYRALTSHDGACRWQYRLFCELQAGSFRDVELATGLGKTSIIPLWVLALGSRISSPACRVPRRLAYIVDRRVVVDQASEFAEQVRSRLEEAAHTSDHALHLVATALQGAGCTPSVLETSTLRGQRALDTHWREDPSRPAIVVGTVDMLGSRLLFSAYGRVGPWGRSLEAGLLGQDCLVVLDEAHLCAPFAATLAAVEQRQRQEVAPFAVIRMGATMASVAELLRRTPGLREPQASSEGSERRQPFRLFPMEEAENKVRDRLRATKRIELIEIGEEPGRRLADWAVERASQEPGAVIGLVLNTVAEARRCVDRLRACGVSQDLIVTLTGSMRGWDRDAVVESDAYGRFQSQRDRSACPDNSVFLVATSCVEVGADIDCDHLGTEACAADSLIQRLGRVNRLGLRGESSVLVVGKLEADNRAGHVFNRLVRLKTALARLRRRSHEAPEARPAPCTSNELSNRLLRGIKKNNLFELRVPPPALTSAVLDDLAMTSKYPETGARPDVGRWLHGSVEEASLYVEFAWREELDRITEPESADRLLNAFPISARETARCPLYEAVEVLGAVRARALEDSGLGARLLLVTRYGETTGMPLRSLPDDEAGLRRLVRNALIVLPPSAGAYDGRFIDPSASDRVTDVAEDAQPSSRARRCRLWVRSGRVSVTMNPMASADTDPRLIIDADTREDELIAEVTGPARILLGARWRLMECAGDANAGVLVARADRRAIEEAEDDDGSLGFRELVMLDRHLAEARSMAEKLCECLRLPPDLRMAVVEAAGQHDLGKDRPWWQRAVGHGGRPPVAKSGQPHFDHTINRGYRHELGSVADLQSEASLGRMEPRIAELCLHLVAAHHGHARPGFRAEAVGPLSTDALQQAIAATPTRFARMQATHGWWGLAWLEALVKAADVLASPEEDGEAPS